MRKRTGRLSRRDAERTLTDPAGSDSALGTTLAAAAGPARPAELRGEDAAVAAFHASRLAAPSPTRDHYVSPTRLAGRATTRLVVAAGAVLALGTGGLAVATGVQLDDLPGLPGLTSDGTQSTARPSDPTSTLPSPSSSPAPDDGQSGSPEGGTSSAQPGKPTSPGGSARPDPQATRLLERACRDALHPGLERGHDDNLATLIERAGGADQVEAFCVDLLGAKPDKPAKPTKPDQAHQAREAPAGQAREARQAGEARPKPEKPTQPDKPSKPAKPEKPTKPAKPGKPDQAGKPGHGNPQKNHSRQAGPMTPG